jgi:hypothetical protein
MRALHRHGVRGRQSMQQAAALAARERTGPSRDDDASAKRADKDYSVGKELVSYRAPGEHAAGLMQSCSNWTPPESDGKLHNRQMYVLAVKTEIEDGDEVALRLMIPTPPPPSQEHAPRRGPPEHQV